MLAILRSVFRPALSLKALCPLGLSLLLTATLCVPALSQEPEEVQPSFLSTREFDTDPGSFRKGTCTFLGKAYAKSIAWYCDSDPHDARYSVPDGYNRFMAMVGVDDKSRIEKTFTFAVIGIDENGKERTLTTQQTSVLHPPREINVSLKGIKILKLRLLVENDRSTDGWWGDARFVVSSAKSLPDIKIGGQPGPSPVLMVPTLLNFEEKALKAQLQSLAQKLKAGVAGTPEKPWDVTVARFLLNPLPGKSIPDENAEMVRSALQTELAADKSLELTPLKESLADGFKPVWAPGDDLDDQARAALNKLVDTRYVVLGTITDRRDPDQAVVKAALYNRKTGKALSDEQIVRIPIMGRVPLVAPQATVGVIDPDDPPEDVPITLAFSPGDELRIHNFEWTIDDEPKGQRNFDKSKSNSQPAAVKRDKKKHKFTLTWNGDGVEFTTPFLGTKKLAYKKVTVEFEMEVNQEMAIEVFAKPDMNQQKLALTARANGLDFNPKWH